MKNRNKLKRIIFFAVIITFTFTACKKENEENLIGPVVCDTANMKYATNILPILVSNCYECHGNGLSQQGPGGAVNFDTYVNTKKQIDNNNLINAIKHTAGFTPMPFGKPMLSSCDIDKIQAWINNGAPNN